MGAQPFSFWEGSQMDKRIIAAALIAAAVSGMAAFAIFALILRPVPLAIEAVDLLQVADGAHIGVCQNKILMAVVRVCVSGHQITGVEVLEHKQSYMDQAKRIARHIVASQSPDVDAISGATLTSDTVKKAVENALRRGMMQ